MARRSIRPSAMSAPRPRSRPTAAAARRKTDISPSMPSGREGAGNFMELGGIPDFYNSEPSRTRRRARTRSALYNECLREAALAHTTEEWMKLGEAAPHPDHARQHARRRARRSASEGRRLLRAAPASDRRPWRAMKPPIKFSKTPASIRRDPPQPGADTDEVLAWSQGRPRSRPIMSDSSFPSPTDWRRRARYIDRAKYEAMYAHSLKDPGRLLGASRPSASTGSSRSRR